MTLLAAATGWAGVLSGALALAGLLLKWYLETRPQRARQKRKDRNAEIHRAVLDGDQRAVGDWLARMRAEDD